MKLTIAGVMLASAASAISDRGDARLIPAAPGSLKRQGPPLQVRFGAGDVATVTSYSFEPASPQDESSRYWCAVTVRQPGKPTQVVVTVGTGSTWYGDCGGLYAIGALPAPPGQARFAVVNDVSSPSVTACGAAIVVRRGGRWQLDEELAARLNENMPVTIPKLRRALKSTSPR